MDKGIAYFLLFYVAPIFIILLLRGITAEGILPHIALMISSISLITIIIANAPGIQKEKKYVKSFKLSPKQALKS